MPLTLVRHVSVAFVLMFGAASVAGCAAGRMTGHGSALGAAPSTPPIPAGSGVLVSEPSGHFEVRMPARP